MQVAPPRIIALSDLPIDKPPLLRSTGRTIEVPKEQIRFLHRDQYEEVYYPNPQVQPDEDICEPMYDWQERSYPACNCLHEWDLRHQVTSSTHDGKARVLGQGTWRVTLRALQYDGTPVAFKVIRAGGYDDREGEFDEQNFAFHRRDAVMYEKVSASPFVLRMFGHCGLSGVFEEADSGVLEDQLWFDDEETGGEAIPDWSSLKRLRISRMVAMGLKDVHGVGGGPYSPFSISDLFVDQVLQVGGQYKISDFNRGYFIRRNAYTGRPCPYDQVYDHHYNAARAPEEFREGSFFTAAVDIWHLGSTIYAILFNLFPFDDHRDSSDDEEDSNDDDDDDDDSSYSDRKIRQILISGGKPTQFREFLESRDPAINAMLTAIDMCHKHLPRERATAAEVADYLESQLEELEAFVEERCDIEDVYSLVPPEFRSVLQQKQ